MIMKFGGIIKTTNSTVGLIIVGFLTMVQVLVVLGGKINGVINGGVGIHGIMDN